MADEKPAAGTPDPAQKKQDEQPATPPAQKSEGGGDPASIYKAELDKLKEEHERYRKEQTRAIHELKRENKSLKDLVPKEVDDDVPPEEVVEVEGNRFRKTELERLKIAAKAAGFGEGADELKELVSELREMRATFAGDRDAATIARYASSPEEAELIRHHLEHSIKRSGNLETDIKRARALAVAPVLERAAADEASREALLSSVSGASIGGQGTGSAKSVSPSKKEAISLLRELRGDVDWSKKV